MNYRIIDPAGLERRQIYRLLVGSVVPRPIAWVSTISKNGDVNLAPFSFFTCVSHSPPMLSISVGTRACVFSRLSRFVAELPEDLYERWSLEEDTSPAWGKGGELSEGEEAPQPEGAVTRLADPEEPDGLKYEYDEQL